VPQTKLSPCAQRQKLRELGYVEMMQRVWTDSAFCDLLKSNPKAAVSALLGFPVRFADLDQLGLPGAMGPSVAPADAVRALEATTQRKF
jgi:hypothetical protein